MEKLHWQDKARVLFGMIMVKLGKLPFDAFTVDELNELITPHFPQQFSLPLPVGRGDVSLVKGQIQLPGEQNRIHLQMLASISIEALANTIYRAHLAITVSASPHYEAGEQTLHIQDIEVDAISLINDDYSLLKDTGFLINKLIPGGLTNLIGGPLRGALNLLSAGTTEQAIRYLELYIGGSKQRILDYHKPQLKETLLTLLEQQPLHYRLREDQWREYLFSRLGKTVSVHEKKLKFWF